MNTKTSDTFLATNDVEFAMSSGQSANLKSQQDPIDTDTALSKNIVCCDSDPLLDGKPNEHVIKLFAVGEIVQPTKSTSGKLVFILDSAEQILEGLENDSNFLGIDKVSSKKKVCCDSDPLLAVNTNEHGINVFADDDIYQPAKSTPGK
jgi:hypothetical protein